MSADLTIHDLVVARAGRQVLHGLELSVPAGAVTALLGPNGAGKSSLVLALGGLLPLEQGSVRLGDRELAGASPDTVRKAGLAVVPEGRWLLRGLTVEDNLQVATYPLSRREARAGRERALALFPELEKRLTSQASLLSGGEQQMVALAQALATNPRVLVVDELSLGLAPVVVRRLAPVLEQVAAEGTAVLLIEQFAEVALGVAHHAHVIQGGRLAFSGGAQELRDNPELLSGAYLHA
ncbi:ATP-binding cassette domain-containing protein [Nocardioides sp. GY 10127]|uniref:ABC transporter ATP-binding protein n=1 Tax=Nocardioides sp. GY 10127 TaxID=2569762 RepID=UPI0010A76EDC|nr:ATP-binding cassette domain-containing protein [Nocardioides sp. GY 10127]TIC79992.1 ATP-binding cassette domain-containing protein [Nocardioides sp. GY 10127]